MSKRNADYYDQKANNRQKFIVKAAKKRLTAKNRPKEFFRDAKQGDLFKEEILKGIIKAKKKLGEDKSFLQNRLDSESQKSHCLLECHTTKDHLIQY